MKLHPKAILLGIITDFVLSVVASLVLWGFGFTTSSPTLYVWSLILGLVADAVGGYVTARSSRSSKLSNTLAFGVTEILIGLIVIAFVAEPLWFNVANFILVIPAALLGAYWAGVTTE